jgi:hypothetical protein
VFVYERQKYFIDESAEDIDQPFLKTHRFVIIAKITTIDISTYFNHNIFLQPVYRVYFDYYNIHIYIIKLGYFLLMAGLISCYASPADNPLPTAISICLHLAISSFSGLEKVTPENPCVRSLA